MYMKIILGAIGMLLIIGACGKDTFNSKPQLTLKELRGNVVDTGGAVRITIEYTDKEGDLAGVPLYVEKKSSVAPCPNSGVVLEFIDSQFYKISPELPRTNNQRGEIEFTLEYPFFLATKCGIETEEMSTLRFWIKDQAGNLSDTLTAPAVRLLKY